MQTSHGLQLSQDIKDSIQYDTYAGFCKYHSMTPQEQTTLRNRFAAKRYRQAKKVRVQQMETRKRQLEQENSVLLAQNAALKQQLAQLEFTQYCQDGSFLV